MCCFYLLIRFYYSPKAAIDDEKNGDQEGGHLAGVDKGVCPINKTKTKTTLSFRSTNN